MMGLRLQLISKRHPLAGPKPGDGWRQLPWLVDDNYLGRFDAIAGQVLKLKASWTKGGKERDIPITTDAQRELLDEVKRFAGDGSLIPAEISYRDQLNRFKAQTALAQIHRVHGLRHQYAQSRYEALTGWKAPAAHGPSAKQLNPAQKAVDREARLAISRELGHEREQITVVYLGR